MAMPRYYFSGERPVRRIHATPECLIGAKLQGVDPTESLVWYVNKQYNGGDTDLTCWVCHGSI